MTCVAVLWDLDGTLVDSEPIHLRSLLDVLTEEGHAVDSGIQESLVGRTAKEAHAFLVGNIGLELSYGDLVRRKYAAYRRRRAELHPRTRGVETFLDLGRRGVRQAIVSNSDRIILGFNLAAIGLDLPDMITVSRNDVRQGKPAPDPYLRAAWLLDADPSDCIVIEDSATGATSGLAAGMRVVAWPMPEAPDEPFPRGVVHVCDDDLERLIQDAINGKPLSATDQPPSCLGAQ